ncbi:MAG: hypothetical protein JSS07_11445 [Proteobacteria bacterium]|nr:hypothetical protein [Pseudomonadota bacterium]
MQILFVTFLLLCGLIMLIPLGTVCFRHYKRRISYGRILKTIDSLFVNTNPFAIAKSARIQDSTEFLYGEIEICTLLDLVACTQPLSKQVFYDLGSGCGKTLFAVKLAYPFLKVKGIEMIDALHQLAVQKYDLYLAKSHLSSSAFELVLIHQNFIQVNILDADIIFINATAYSKATWEQILDKLIQLKVGTKVIITSKTLPATHFSKTYQGMEWMSWGLTSTYVYEKTH